MLLVAACGDNDNGAAEDISTTERVGFELLEVQDDGTIWAWIASDMTQEQFAALGLPAGWLKNQPREGVPDSSRFYGSPGAGGVLVEEEHFGFEWFHSATVTSMGTTLDELLATRDALAGEVSDEVRARAEAVGLEVLSVALKDVILPGDMKALMNRVIEMCSACA